jgi:hypothetical protein
MILKKIIMLNRKNYYKLKFYRNILQKKKLQNKILKNKIKEKKIAQIKNSSPNLNISDTDKTIIQETQPIEETQAIEETQPIEETQVIEETQPIQAKFVNKITILLTSTVNVQNKEALFQINKKSRINTYLKSVKKWLDDTTLNIVLVENSGYLFLELNEYLIKYKDRFEIISFKENSLKNAKYLKNNKSKGASEIFAINYAYYNSKILKNSIFIIKITGRYFIKELELYLNNYDLNKYDALRQNNMNRCEIVGTHIKNFKKVFALKLLDKNGKYNGHVESIYKYRISLLNNKFVCKQFSIEPTKRGGLNQILTKL